MAENNIGPYKIVETIGESGQALSYRAIHRSLDREVFLKVLPSGRKNDAERRARFVQEAKALAMVDHPAIVRVYDFGEWQDKLYWASEYVEGLDLRELISKSGLLFWSEVKPMSIALLGGLKALHSSGIIHRDIKPSNIVLGSGGPKLADLGLARIVQSPVVTQSDALLGTPAYMAPEILRGTPAGPQTDLFSLGATLFEALTGKRAFLGESFQEVLANVAHTDPLESIECELPPNALGFLAAMMAKDPDMRPKDVDAALHLLESAEESKRGGAGGRRASIYLIVGLLAIVAYFAAPLFNNRRPPRETTFPNSTIALPTEDTLYSAIEGSPLIEWGAKLPDSGAPPEKRIAPIARIENQSLHGAVQPEEQPTIAERDEDEFVELWVLCSPWAEISIDGAVLDTTPLTSPLQLAPGTHSVRLSHPTYPPVETVIEAALGNRDTLNVSLPDSAGFLQVNTIPWATLTVDGIPYGTTPVEGVLILSPGLHELTANNPFYGERTETFSVDRGETANILIRYKNQLER